MNLLNSLNGQTTELSKYSSQQKQDLLPDCNYELTPAIKTKKGEEKLQVKN